MIARESSSDPTKQESSTSTTDNGKTFKASSSSTTTSWSRLKDPRIVRVSRAFGGKDRHSKVCTVRGLRDRRVRLSVPTAIQLYDLQDRLGLNQPSKVVDWLLNAAKNEIDELPPLQIPPGTFNPTLLPMLNSHEIRSASQSTKHGLKIGGTTINWNHDSSDQSKEHVSEGRTNEEEKQFSLENNQDSYARLENSHSSVPPSLMNGSNSMSYNQFARWDSSSLTLSQPPRSLGLSPHQHEDWHNFSLIPMQAATGSFPPSGSHHQVLVYQTQPGMSTQAYFPTQLNFQRSEMSSSPLSSPVDSTTQPASRQIHFNMTANLLPSQSNDRS